MPITTNNFDRFRRAVLAEQRRRLKLAAITVQRDIRDLLNVSGTGVMGPGGVIVPAVKRTKKTIYGAFPSAPGSPPHKQTGRLKSSVTWELIQGVKMLARVGTNVKYGRWLELGTSRMLPRPWLVRAFRDAMPAVRSILTAPWKWTG